MAHLSRCLYYAVAIFLLTRTASAASHTNLLSTRQEEELDCDSPITRLSPKLSLQCYQKDAQCYALPYGVLGFISHLLTYYSTILNALGRRPFLPGRKQERTTLNIALAFAQLVTTVIPAALTVARCRGEFQRIAVWMVFTSVTSSLAMIIGASRRLYKHHYKLGADPTIVAEVYPLQTHDDDPEYIEPEGEADRAARKRERHWYIVAGWLIGLFFLIGCLIGLSGVFRIVRDVWDVSAAVKKVTLAFFLPAFCLALFTLCLPFAIDAGSMAGSCITLWSFLMFAVQFVMICLFATLLYMDLILAAVTGRWSGLATGSGLVALVLYWVYFLGERISLGVS